MRGIVGSGTLEIGTSDFEYERVTHFGDHNSYSVAVAVKGLRDN